MYSEADLTWLNAAKPGEVRQLSRDPQKPWVIKRLIRQVK